MYTILLCITYDGKDFYGFQRQLDKRTVQQELEEALSSILDTVIVVVPSGRTDRGVHAERQYVHFKLWSDNIRIPPDKIFFAVNTVLPPDIRVYWSRAMSPEFHVRYSAVKRGYYYQFYEGKVFPPYLRNSCMKVAPGLDWQIMQEELQQFLGTHNFSAFSSHNPQIEHYVRTVYRAELERVSSEITRLHIEANGFLWKMVRSIVGTCVEREVRRTYRSRRAKKKVLSSELSISEILSSEDRNLAGTVAPPWGLFLYDVQYSKEYEIECKLS